MLKLLAVAALMTIGNLWVTGLSCSSCGVECASACGTRRFRTCCFNYLRKKRDPETDEATMPTASNVDDLEMFKAYPIPDDLGLSWSSILTNGKLKFDSNSD